MAGFQNDVVFANNVDFSGQGIPAATISTNGQLLIGSTALNAGGTHINVGNLTSPDGSIAIGYASPNITLQALGGHAVTSFAMQVGTSPITPDGTGQVVFNGATVAAGTHPVRTDGTALHTMALEVQISQAIAATDATKIGLSNFDSARFTVDANGFVSASGTGLGQTITGDTGGALAPTAGNWNIFGAYPAAGTNPVRTTGAGSTLTVNVQISQALAASDATKIGLSNFDSNFFTVDANGFVSFIGNTPTTSTTTLFDDFIYRTPDLNNSGIPYGPFGLAVVATGGTVSKSNVANHPGVITWTVSSNTAGCSIMSSGIENQGPSVGVAALTFEIMARLNTLSSANPRYLMSIGCWDTTSSPDPLGSGNFGIYFHYTDNVNTGQWQMICTDGTGTATASSTTAADTNWHRFKITINAAGTAAHFYIDDVELANSPITTHIPTTPQLLQIAMKSTSGSNSKSFDVDYFYAKFEFTR